MTKRGLIALALALVSATTRADWVDAAGTDIEIRPGQVYATASGQDLKLDLFLPVAARAAAAKPVPLLVYFHGGGWVVGSKEIATLRLLPYLRMGWAAALVQYRLATTAPAPAAVEDARCALRWLHGQAAVLRVDPAKVVLSGGSAGAHLALIAAMLPAGNRFDRGCASEGGGRWRDGREATLPVAAVVNWFGIADVADLLAGPNAKHYAIEWFGALPDAPRLALARELSPLQQVRADTPPIITLHGEDDDVVPFAQASALHARLGSAGRPNRLVKVAGARHSFSPAQAAAAMGPIREFLAAQGLPTAAAD